MAAARLAPSALLTALLLLLSWPAAAAERVLTIINWEEFLAPKVVKTLKNRYALDIRQITFTTQARK